MEFTEADLDLGKHTADDAVGHELVDFGVDVFNTGVGDDRWFLGVALRPQARSNGRK